MSDPPVKRYRRDPSPKSEDSEEDDGYVPYVSVANQISNFRTLISSWKPISRYNTLEAVIARRAARPASGHGSPVTTDPSDEEVTLPLASAPRQRKVNITISPRIVIIMSLPGSLQAL